MPDQPDKSGKENDTEEPAGEVRRDKERDDRGPTYHGADWDKAKREHGRAALDEPAEEEVRSDVERADEEKP